MKSPIIIAAVLLLSSFSFAGGEQVPIQKRFNGGGAGLEAASEQVILDQATWKKLWKKSHKNISPGPKVPKIDFEKQTVLAVFLGTRNTGGYSIKITSVQNTGKQIEVSVNETGPPPGSIVTQALTTPYEIVVIPKTDKPVKFIKKESERSR